MTTFNILKLLCMIDRDKEPTDYCVCECKCIDSGVCNKCTREEIDAEYNNN